MVDSGAEVLDRAQRMLPGPELVAVLAQLDVSVLNVADSYRFVGLSAQNRSWLEGRELRALARMAGPSDDSRSQAAALLGVTMHVSEGTARNRIELAASLAERLPVTLDAFEDGDIHLGQARVIEEETRYLDAADARAVEDYVLAGSHERTPALMRRIAKRRALRLDPASQHRRHNEAVQHRSVYFHLLPDGMAELGATLPAGEAIRCRAAIEAAADNRPDCGEGIDARRADAFVGLLTGDQAPAVELILRATNGQPVTVPGIGALDADAIRNVLAPAAKVVIRPLGVAPQPVNGYRPTAGVEQWVRACYPTCRFPDCPRPAHRCDLDHVKPYGAGGTTCACNLIPLCRRHHRLKTFHHWTPKLHPDRSITWTTPTGTTINLPPPDN